MPKVEVRVPITAFSSIDIVNGSVDLSKTSPRMGSQVQAFSDAKSAVVSVSREVVNALFDLNARSLPKSANGWAIQFQLVVKPDNIGRAGFSLLGRDIVISGTVEREPEGEARVHLSYTSSSGRAPALPHPVSVEHIQQRLRVVGPNGDEYIVPAELTNQVMMLVGSLDGGR